MATLVCPRCKRTIAVEEVPPLRCSRCTHFDLAHLACVHPEILEPERVVDPDEARECLHFHFRPLPKEAPRFFAGVSLFAWSTLAVIAVIFTLLYIGLSSYTRVGPTETILQLRTQSVGTVVSGEPFDIIFGIYNRGGDPARRVTLYLGRDTLRFLELLETDPPALVEDEEQGSFALDYGDLSAGHSVLGRLTFRGVRSGAFTLRITLSADNDPHPQTVEMRTRVTP